MILSEAHPVCDMILHSATLVASATYDYTTLTAAISLCLLLIEKSSDLQKSEKCGSFYCSKESKMRKHDALFDPEMLSK